MWILSTVPHTLTKMASTPKKPLYRSLEAWKALKQRDLEYAVNLFVAGQWIVDGVVEDDYFCLDAKVGSKRCQENSSTGSHLGSRNPDLSHSLSAISTFQHHEQNK